MVKLGERSEPYKPLLDNRGIITKSKYATIYKVIINVNIKVTSSFINSLKTCKF